MAFNGFNASHEEIIETFSNIECKRLRTATAARGMEHADSFQR